MIMVCPPIYLSLQVDKTMFSDLTANMKQNLETTLPKSAFTDKDDMIPVMADPKVSTSATHSFFVLLVAALSVFFLSCLPGGRYVEAQQMIFSRATLPKRAVWLIPLVDNAPLI